MESAKTGIVITCDNSLAFRAIKELIGDLRELYSNPKSPLALYNRLIQHIKDNEQGPGINKCISGFVNFFNAHAKHLDSVELMMEKIPRGTIIPYGTSDKVFIEIQKFLHLADEESREAIRMHLLTIATIMEPDETALNNLDTATATSKAVQKDLLARMGLEADSKEGAFISNAIAEIQESMKDCKTDDPTAAIMGLMPMLPGLMGKLRDGVTDGSLDMTKLISSMGSAFTGTNGIQMPPGMPSFTDMQAMFSQAAEQNMNHVEDITNENSDYDAVD